MDATIFFDFGQLLCSAVNSSSIPAGSCGASSIRSSSVCCLDIAAACASSGCRQGRPGPSPRAARGRRRRAAWLEPPAHEASGPPSTPGPTTATSRCAQAPGWTRSPSPPSPATVGCRRRRCRGHGGRRARGQGATSHLRSCCERPGTRPPTSMLPRPLPATEGDLTCRNQRATAVSQGRR